MTNRELLQSPKEVLGPLDRQRRFLLQVDLTPMPCPACSTPLSALTAAGTDIDAYQFGEQKCAFRCPQCMAELEQIVPLFGSGPGWYWQLKRDWLAERLRKANLYDQEHPKE